jgi:hypothetical protein
VRGKISEAEKAMARKLYNHFSFTVEDIAVELERSENSIRSILGLEVVSETPVRTRTAYGHGYESLTVELDRGEIKFYLPKELTENDAQKVIDAIYEHYNFLPDDFGSQEDDIFIPSKPEDKFAIMRRIIEEEAIDEEEVPA